MLDPEPEPLPLLLLSTDASPSAPIVALLAPPQLATSANPATAPADTAHFK